MSTLTETQATLPTGSWREDRAHSHVGFEVGYAGGTFRGSFAPFEAKLEVADDGSAVLKGESRAESVHVLDENLAAHLLAPDFFDAERTPVLRFESTGIRREGDKVAVSGVLTIKGASVPVELDGTVSDPLPHPSGTERFVLRLGTTVDRRAFGIDWNMELPNGDPALANDVSLSAEIYLLKE